MLDRESKVRYQGRIDDQFGIGYRRNNPRDAIWRWHLTSCWPATM